MNRLFIHFRDGDFLTRTRLRLWAWFFVAGFAAALVYMAATAHGLSDFKGRPLGTDFSDVYATGTLVAEGTPAAAYDPLRHYSREQKIFGTATPFYGWHYPPFFLPVAGALALLPYIPALILWQSVGLALYLGALALLLKRKPDSIWILLALGFPAIFVNLTHGQNGFLTAALFAGALALLDKRPIAAGILFGLLAFKPQFAILVPLVLAATGRWKPFASAATTIALMALGVTLAYGDGIWSAFFASTRFSREVVLEQGGTGFEKIQSVFAFVRLWGGGVKLAYGAQTLATLGVAAALFQVWRAKTGLSYKGASLCLGALLATPYCLDYDMMLLAPAIALMASEGMARGFLPYEKSVLAGLWLVPIFTRTIAGAIGLPLGLIAMATAFALCIRQARRSSPSLESP